MKTFYLKSKTVSKTTRIVHISDSHLIVPDKADGDLYKKEKERKVFFEREALCRTGEVHYAEEKLAEAVDYAKGADLTVFTGDIIEFPTLANVKKMSEYFAKTKDYIYTYGNHDYANWLKSVPKQQQKEENTPLFQQYIANDLEIAVKEVNGVKVVGLDNSCFQFTQRQLEELKKIFEEGKDVILAMHIPLEHPSLHIIGYQKVNQMAEACGTDYNLSSDAYANETTKAVIALIKEKHEQVLALLVGHVHFDAVVPYYNNMVQYICLPTYLNDFYEFIIEKAE